jgi:hypothetical protein
MDVLSNPEASPEEILQAMIDGECSDERDNLTVQKVYSDEHGDIRLLASNLDLAFTGKIFIIINKNKKKQLISFYPHNNTKRICQSCQRGQ